LYKIEKSQGNEERGKYMKNQEMKRTINSNYSIDYSQASVDCNDVHCHLPA